MLGPLCLINLLVGWLGDSAVSPLSPYFLVDKARALGLYAWHRPACLLSGHENVGPIAVKAARRHGLPPGLLESLLEVESNGRAHRISAAGAMGPGQLMPSTAALLRVSDPFDPEEAIDGSARHLAELLRRFGDVRLAVAAYNAGAGAVDGKVPRNGETEFYVARVLAEYARR
ncbi:MAG TPA: lytic transglycosylase domain-containing protein, partial [Longimicrobium sp.]|nr:lytic transglycosylase domain-containing protein [Longimicrobium sp.]